MYLRDGPAETGVRAATFRWKLHIQVFCFTQSQYTDTGPTCPSADPITADAWQGSHWSTKSLSHWYDWTWRKSHDESGNGTQVCRSRGGRLTTRPVRRCITSHTHTHTHARTHAHTHTYTDTHICTHIHTERGREGETETERESNKTAFVHQLWGPKPLTHNDQYRAVCRLRLRAG